MFDSTKLDLADPTPAPGARSGRILVDDKVWDAWMQALLPGCLRMQFEAWSPGDAITQFEINEAVDLADKTMQAALHFKRAKRKQGSIV